MIPERTRPSRSSARLPLAWQRISWRAPEWICAVAVIAAWSGITIGALRPEAPVGHVGHLHLGSDPNPALITIRDLYCVVGMMVPLVLPNLRQVAFANLWDRRYRGMVVFLAGYLAVWILATILINVLVEITQTTGGWGATLALVGVLAITWQLTDKRRKAVRGCHLMLPLAPSGWRADRDCLALGVTVGSSCTASCWALMALVVAGGHHPALVFAVFALMVTERFGPFAFVDLVHALAGEIRFAFNAPALQRIGIS
jgi:predicted metal-binding membrane protein